MERKNRALRLAREIGDLRARLVRAEAELLGMLVVHTHQPASATAGALLAGYTVGGACVNALREPVTRYFDAKNAVRCDASVYMPALPAPEDGDTMSARALAWIEARPGYAHTASSVAAGVGARVDSLRTALHRLAQRGDIIRVGRGSFFARVNLAQLAEANGAGGKKTAA